MIKIEQLKFAYGLINNILPVNLSKLVKTDHNGTDLRKTHNYQTRFKAEPNLPRTKSSNYQNSFLHENIKVISTLPTNVKHKKSLKSFTHAIKRLV